MMKYVSLLPLLVTLVASIDLKCDLDNTISDSNVICVISDVVSNHEGDEFTSYIKELYAEVVFKNSSLLKFPKEIVQGNNALALWLEQSGLKIISPGTFIGVTSLVKLYLGGNRIESIDKNMFAGLESLQTLDLSRNKIKDVAVNAFYGMEQLEYLNLASNKLTSLSLSFKSTYGLKIDVRDNVDLNAVDYTCDDLAEACSILILDDNTVDLTCDVDNQYMDGVCMFQDIQVNDEAVSRVIRKWAEFGVGYYRSEHLNTEYFKEIVFVNSSLYSLPTILFDYYVYLEYLNVSSTAIQTLEAYSFKNASALVDIDLSFNHITEVGANVFVGAKELSVIDLSDNRIEKVDKHAFSMLSKLTSLLLNGNQLKTIDLELRFNFPLVLNVSNCSTALLRVKSYMETYIMPYSSSVIDACNNNLNEVDLIENGPIVTLMLENNTGNLNMSDITKIRSLTTLSLRNVSNEIKNGAFKAMPQLENLDLSYTNLKLKYGLFGPRSKLRKLDLSYNDLKQIDFYKLGALHELEELILDGNSLTKLETFDLMMIFSHLKRISFLDNVLHCDVLAQTIIELQQRQIKIEYPKELEQSSESEGDNVNGIGCLEFKEGDAGRNIALEKQLDRLEKTFLTLYALKKAYL